MSEVIRSLSDAIEKIYRSFVLRDLLGFVLPGSIFLLSFWLLVGSPERIPLCESTADGLQCLMLVAGKSPKALPVLAFLGVSYLTGWVLQCIHYGIADWIFQILRYHKLSSLIWPLAGIFFYAKAITGLSDHSYKTKSLITAGALDPDKGLKKIRGTKALSRLQESLPYFERTSALMLMTGNIAIAGIPLLIVIASKMALGWWTVFGVLPLLLLYLEHWRLFYARNLRHELAIDAAIQENEIIST